jgi:hypothetical protein
MRENWGRLDDQSFYECGGVVFTRRRWLEHLDGFKRPNPLRKHKTLPVRTSHLLLTYPLSGRYEQVLSISYQSQKLSLVTPSSWSPGAKNQKLGTTGTKPKIFTPSSWPQLINASACSNVCALHRLNKFLKRCISTNWAPLSAVVWRGGKICRSLTLGVFCAASAFLELHGTFCSGNYIFAFEGHFKE